MRRLPASAALVLLPAAMFAHEGHSHGGFLAGVAHPWNGVDHLLAMIVVGLLAARIGGHGRWLVPLGFVVPMALGGGLALAGVPLPGAEWGIAASLVLFGLMAAWKRAPTTWAAMAVVAPFAICHGYAHSAELSAGAGSMAGFLLATCALHAIGLAGGLLAATSRREGIVQFAGGAVAAAGLALVLGRI